MRFMDKLIEHPEFIGRVSRIFHVVFVAREEFSHARLKVEIDSGTYDPKASDYRSSHTIRMDDALVSFVTLDYAALISLGQLYMVEIRQLCVLEDVDAPMGDAAGGDDVDGDRVGVGGVAELTARESVGGEDEVVGRV